MILRRAILLIILIHLFISCDKSIDPIEEVNDKVISISVSYVDNSFNIDTIPDVGSKLFVFHNISMIDITSYEYKGEGVLIRKDNSPISFNEVYTLPQSGEKSIVINKNMNKVLIIVESNYYKKDRRIVYISEDQLNYLVQTKVHKVFFLE